MFDIAVIGLGMIGSAALRYLSQPAAGLHTVGIGPAEPRDWASHQGAFASHYDQAQITRVTDPNMNSYTAHDYPYIDQLAEGVFVCTGGCGGAAKSSDEIGRAGALLAQYGEWRYDLPAATFRAEDTKC